MAVQETPQSADAREARIRELTEENGLLFEQLHVVQEELEKYHHKLKECEQRKGTVTGTQAGAGTPEPAAILAENQKLQALVEQQRIALGIETQNSLPSRLGNMFIAGAGSAGSILKLLCKLRTLWKALDKTVPPAELGGKTFQKVIDAHTEGGPEAVETLLDSVFIASPMRANAYTALARHLMPLDVKQTADNARLAWETDPRPYRLKWLAFRLHDAGDAITAEALLDMLPADIPMCVRKRLVRNVKSTGGKSNRCWHRRQAFRSWLMSAKMKWPRSQRSWTSRGKNTNKKESGSQPVLKNCKNLWINTGVMRIKRVFSRKIYKNGLMNTRKSPMP